MDKTSSMYLYVIVFLLLVPFRRKQFNAFGIFCRFRSVYTYTPYYGIKREKGGNLTQSYGKTLVSTENSKTNGQHKSTTNSFDYTTIADRLRTNSWSKSSHPTGDVKPVYGYPIFPLTATAV